ncbi:MAG: nicotinamide riboside transporter PnuC [Pyrinomonadaceae bacterium MAG19_C2-C3]|nr:nicotinamide riboside transporter PnuC [Pyrinomonadaceae bacterium MAG19_C2-C3]
MKRTLEWITLIVGIGFIFAAWQRWIAFDLIETLGFVTGAICVYLGIKQNIFTFPVGIANNIFFLILFSRSRLFGDAGLQVVYMALAIHGWYSWLRGGEHHTKLKVTHGSFRLLAGVFGIALVGMFGLGFGLQAAGGAAPLLDALTTILSLVAQFLLNRKIIEHWFVWIIADVIYIYLYITRGLNLTALLYFVFLCLCIAGFIAWRSSMRGSNTTQHAAA